MSQSFLTLVHITLFKTDLHRLCKCMDIIYNYTNHASTEILYIYIYIYIIVYQGNPLFATKTHVQWQDFAPPIEFIMNFTLQRVLQFLSFLVEVILLWFLPWMNNPTFLYSPWFFISIIPCPFNILHNLLFLSIFVDYANTVFPICSPLSPSTLLPNPPAFPPP